MLPLCYQKEIMKKKTIKRNKGRNLAEKNIYLISYRLRPKYSGSLRLSKKLFKTDRIKADNISNAISEWLKYHDHSLSEILEIRLTNDKLISKHKYDYLMSRLIKSISRTDFEIITE